MLDGLDVARRAGLPVHEKGPLRLVALPGELSGAVVLASAFTSAEVSGRSWPTIGKLHAWRHQYIHLAAGDAVRLHSHKPSKVLLWPFALVEQFVMPIEEAPAIDSSEGLS